MRKLNPPGHDLYAEYERAKQEEEDRWVIAHPVPHTIYTYRPQTTLAADRAWFAALTQHLQGWSERWLRQHGYRMVEMGGDRFTVSEQERR